MSNTPAAIVYTLTDEAPRLATASLLPIVRTFAAQAGVVVAVSDISLAARILAQFPERLTEQQRVPDALTGLGRLTQRPEANITSCWKTAKAPAQKPAHLIIVAAILDSPCMGQPNFPRKPKTLTLPRASRRLPRRCRTGSKPSWTNSPPCRGTPPTSAAITCPTWQNWTPSCAPAPPSTKRWPCWTLKFRVLHRI